MSTATGSAHPIGWTLTTLGEPMSWGSGGTPLRSRADYYDGDIPWAIIGDLTDGFVRETASCISVLGLRESAAKWVQPGAVLLAMYGSIGKLGISSVPLTTNQAIAFTNPAPIDTKYLFYYLMSVRSELIAHGKGGTQSNISQAVIKAFPFIVAPFPEQHRIVSAIESYFTRLDDAVASLERVYRNLKRYRASVLMAAVEGRLVPTEAALARAEGREYEPASVLLTRILAERRRRWEELELAKMTAGGKVPKDDKWKAKYKEPATPDMSDLPELPEGWCWASIDQLSGLVRNGYSKRPQDTGSVRILRISAVRPLRVDLSESKWLSGDPNDYNSDLIENGDLLFTRYNGTPALVGVAGLVRRVDRPTVHPDKLIKVRLLGGSVFPQYLELAVNSGASRRFIEVRIRTTAGQSGISGGDIRQVPVPLPPRAEQERIVVGAEQHLTAADEASVTLQACTDRLSRLRQSILKCAFEGRLVDQDPNDEPASVLLERIRAERAAKSASSPTKRPRHTSNKKRDR